MYTNLKRREFLKTAGAFAAAAVLPTSIGLSATASVKKSRPNIVFIMADDVSPEVLGCYGGATYKTPNIDKLAQTGTRFTHCYSSPVCAPTRVKLLTGRLKLLTGRYGFRNYKKWGHIPDDEITFGHVLKDAGYATAIAGKWQMVLQKKDPDHVTKMGFEQNSVFGWHEGPRYDGPFIYENGKTIPCLSFTVLCPRHQQRPAHASACRSQWEIPNIQRTCRIHGQTCRSYRRYSR